MSEEHEEVGEAGEAVRVFVRIRPLNKRELAEQQTIGWDFDETSMIEETQNGQRIYAYDYVFGPQSTNQITYDICGKPVVLKALEGFNGTVFTYGQTGSGKTWTMRGCESDPGMMVLCIRDIFDWVESHPQLQYTLRVSYMEVYNEEINDLLSEGKNLRIVSEDAARGAVIGGLDEVVCSTPQDFLELLRRGEASRSYASTSMNADSSRSHTIYRVAIEVKDIFDDGGSNNAPGRVSYLNLVDLAGSERQKSTNATGKVLKEGANINKSLLSLGAVISKLGEASSRKKGSKPVFIPYRDSKLTRILKQSLGGNTMTSILCAVTPAPMHREETVSTLKFGQLCKTIKNIVKSNVEALDEKTMLKQCRQLITELRAQLEEAQSGADAHSANVDLLREKSDLETKVRTLESLVLNGTTGIPESELATIMQHAQEGAGDVGTSTVSSKLLQDAQAELSRQNEKVAELNRKVASLKAQVLEFGDFQEAKKSVDEYHNQKEQELEEEKEKIEKEKETLKIERYKVMAESNAVQEKEGRLGTLINILDERDSKLRQMQGTLKEQMEQWQRSISDLQRREDLVDDWQRNHKARESRLQEQEDEFKAKYLELNKREAALSELEMKAKTQQRELSDREQRLQVALSRVANSEQSFAAAEEKLRAFETSLKKREGDNDIKERELLNRRREMESWDHLLRDKDKKVSSEQRAIDERDEVLRTAEEKLRHRESELERRLAELRQNEAAVNEQGEKLTILAADLEKRNRSTTDKEDKLKVWEEELSSKESDFVVWETSLNQLQERMRGIEEREQQLKERVAEHKKVEDDFFNVRIAQISARHKHELKQLEEMIAQQLRVVSNFQTEVAKSKAELLDRAERNEELEKLLRERDSVIDMLKDELQTMRFEGGERVGDSRDGSDDDAGDRDSCDSDDPEESQLGGNHNWKTKTGRDHDQSSVNSSDTSINGVGRTDSHKRDGQSRHNSRGQSGGRRGSVAPNGDSNSGHHPSKGSSKEFMSQLMDTQRLLRQILENHNALPTNHKGLNRARGVVEDPFVVSTGNSLTNRMSQQRPHQLGSNRGFAGLTAHDDTYNLHSQYPHGMVPASVNIAPAAVSALHVDGAQNTSNNVASDLGNLVSARGEDTSITPSRSTKGTPTSTPVATTNAAGESTTAVNYRKSIASGDGIFSNSASQPTSSGKSTSLGLGSSRMIGSNSSVGAGSLSVSFADISSPGGNSTTTNSVGFPNSQPSVTPSVSVRSTEKAVDSKKPTFSAPQTAGIRGIPISTSSSVASGTSSKVAFGITLPDPERSRSKASTSTTSRGQNIGSSNSVGSTNSPLPLRQAPGTGISPATVEHGERKGIPVARISLKYT